MSHHEGGSSGSSRRLSQIFDPLSRLSELTRESRSTPSSPRLLPRRSRDAQINNVVGDVTSDCSGCGIGSGSGVIGGVVVGGIETINWQEKCLELQLELHRSRTQATRTRDMLREKVGNFLISALFFFFEILIFWIPSKLSTGN